MKLAKILTSGFILSLFFISSIFAQSSASANANVLAQLKKGLAITNLSGDLDFGNIVLDGTPASPQIDPSAGVVFEVTGHPGKAVTVNFNNVTLNNNAWAASNGGTSDNMDFTANLDQTGVNNSYSGAADVTDGESINLVNNGGTGYLYLWLGGSLNIRADQAPGDYTGTFTVSVAY